MKLTPLVRVDAQIAKYAAKLEELRAVRALLVKRGRPRSPTTLAIMRSLQKRPTSAFMLSELVGRMRADGWDGAEIQHPHRAVYQSLRRLADDFEVYRITAASGEVRWSSTPNWPTEHNVSPRLDREAPAVLVRQLLAETKGWFSCSELAQAAHVLAPRVFPRGERSRLVIAKILEVFVTSEDGSVERGKSGMWRVKGGLS